jgi:hypothetical protein
VPGWLRHLPPLPGHRWRDVLREKELRIISTPGRGEPPYAVTTVALAGDVLVVIDKGWWQRTSSLARAEALRTHGERVRQSVAILGRPARVLDNFAFIVKWAISLFSVGTALLRAELGTFGLDLHTAQRLSPLLLASAAFLPRRWLLFPLRPLLRWYIGQRLMRKLPTLGRARTGRPQT